MNNFSVSHVETEKQNETKQKIKCVSISDSQQKQSPRLVVRNKINFLSFFSFIHCPLAMQLTKKALCDSYSMWAAMKVSRLGRWRIMLNASCPEPDG